MNLRYKERIATVACICWLVIALFFTDPFSHEAWPDNRMGNNWDMFVVIGLLPVVIILGTMWIWRGKKDSDQDKDNTNPS